MVNSLKKEVAIVGIGEVGPGKLHGKTARQLHVEACKRAVEDAGITFRDIDGVISPELRRDHHDSRASILAQYLGITPTFTLTQAWGGQTTGSMILYAALAIATGLANTVLVTCCDNLASSVGTSGFMRLGRTAGGSQPQYEWPYGPQTAANYALTAQRHMYEYGTTSEQMAAVAVTFRKHAMRHPKAWKRTPITIKDVLDSRIIASPFHLLDCSLITDGGGAVVMTSAERARDFKQKPIYLLGGAEAHTHVDISYAPSLTTFGAAISGPKALRMAGVELKDIDVYYLYDAFTITAIIQVEDLGFCKKGEGGPFVAEDRLSIDGEFPTNTHGGLLSYGHPGRPGPFSHLIELVLQLRGQAETRQVRNARLALLNAQGGTNSVHCTLILGT